MSSSKSKLLTGQELRMLDSLVPDILKFIGELTKDGIPDIKTAQEKIATWQKK